MICDKCEIARYIDEEAHELVSLPAVKPDVEEVRALARYWHDMCRGRSCTCQHVIGDASPQSRRAAHASLSGRFRRFLRSVSYAKHDERVSNG